MSILTRRNVLLAGTALGAAGGAALTTTAGRAACAGAHARIAETVAKMVRDAAQAERSVVALAYELRCPGCGEPFIKAG